LQEASDVELDIPAEKSNCPLLFPYVKVSNGITGFALGAALHFLSLNAKPGF